MLNWLWLAGLLLGIFIPWSTNVPRKSAAKVVYSLMILNLLVHFVTQAYLVEKAPSPWAGSKTREEIQALVDRQDTYLEAVALTPSLIDRDGGYRWGQILTSNFIHAGWLHVVLNLWMLYLYGRNVEDLFGRRRFIALVFAAAIGGQLLAYMGSRIISTYRLPHVGFSGVVYAVMGAYLVCFPRSRIRGLIIYDTRFWAMVILVLLPLTYLLSFVGQSIAELILLGGLVGIFLFMQPDHWRWSFPAWFYMALKASQDFALSASPTAGDIRISVWSHLGGLLIGMAGGLIVNGRTGLYSYWEDPDKRTSAKPTKAESKQKALMRLQKAAQNSRESARMYLAQRIFIGDADTATDFFETVVLAKFPDLDLEPGEAFNLARMLEKRERTASALHVYHRLSVPGPPPPGLEDAPLRAATLAHRLGPERAVDVLRYLNCFDRCAQLMRDKQEARRLREEILTTAAALDQDIEALQQAAAMPFDEDTHASGTKTTTNKSSQRESVIPGKSGSHQEMPHASGYGGPGQPERRRTQRIQSRILRLAPSNEALNQDEATASRFEADADTDPDHPYGADAAMPSDAQPEPIGGSEGATEGRTPAVGALPDESPERGSDQDFLEQWGKRPLPIQFPGPENRPEKKDESEETGTLQLPKSKPGRIPPRDNQQPPPLPGSETPHQRRRRGSFVDLTGMDKLTYGTDTEAEESTDEPSRDSDD